MVSIGNVPQLTADLFIHTFSLDRVGFLDTDTVTPVSSLREDTQLGATVPIEGKLFDIKNRVAKDEQIE